MSLLSQGSLCLSPALECRWQTCQVTITSISEPCCPRHRIWLHWVTLIPRPPLFLVHCLFYAFQPGALSRQMDSLPSRALPSGTLTHRMSPTPTSSAWLPVRALPTPSLFLSQHLTFTSVIPGSVETIAQSSSVWHSHLFFLLLSLQWE